MNVPDANSNIVNYNPVRAGRQQYIQGVSMFSFPNVKPIWIRYLERFVERYGGSKLERARDLFEQVCGMFGYVLYVCVVR